MIRLEDTVLVLLAAGKSERMGDIGSKLAQPFLSRPLGLHVAVTLQNMPFKQRCAVTSPTCGIDYAAHGFIQIVNDDPARNLSSSVNLGVRCAQEHGAEAVLLALADMPRVTGSHIYRLFDAASGPDTIVASSNGEEPLPPALFGRNVFEKLLTLKGDKGANELIMTGRHVVTNAAELLDVDTPEELERLRELVHAPEALTLPGTKRYSRD